MDLHLRKCPPLLPLLTSITSSQPRMIPNSNTEQLYEMGERRGLVVLILELELFQDIKEQTYLKIS